MPDDRNWSQRLSAGDGGALKEMFDAHYVELVGFAARLVGSSDVAEEIVQEVFLAIWRNRDRGNLRPENIPAYLFGAVRKGATSHLRHVHVERRWRERVTSGELPVGSSAPAADEQTRFNDLVAAVRVIVDELPPRMRQAFLLRRQHGLPYAEIAQVMGIAPKTVEVQIGAALRTLRARLSQFYD